jgi:basic membrane lipoprotein Med (substrate-binding protein (PBP1-ABC) superfamily)
MLPTLPSPVLVFCSLSKPAISIFQSTSSTWYFADLRLTSNTQADVTEIVVQNGHFIVKTGLMGDYEFNAATHDRAQKWKKEIEQRVEQSKLSRSGVLENDKYKESYGHFKDLTGTITYSQLF